MDKTPAKTNSNNANAPGTWPTQNIDLDTNVDNAQPVSGSLSNDPKSPYAADPMNSGVSTQSAANNPATGDPSEPNTELELELGGTGTILIHGILAESDYNPDLTGRKRIEIYDQMRKGDATVRLGLAAVKMPILSASWFVKAGKDEGEGGARHQFIVEELMQNPNFSFTQFLRQALLFCDYGNSFFEKVWRMRMDGKIGWKKFAPRLPKTIWRYTLEDGITPGITQVLPTGGGNIQIPQWKLLMFVNEMEGSNYEGISLLRSAYKHWYYKDTYYKIDAIATERQGMGVPVIIVPPQANPQDKAKAKLIAKNMRVNEQAYIDLPIGFRIEYIDTKAKELKEVWEGVKHHDRQILKAFLAHFLDMGATSGGSRNLSDDQSELFLVSLKYTARIFQEQMNLAIRELVDLNFSNTQQRQYPTLEVGGIGQVDFAQLAQALLQMVTSGVILPDTDLENYVRQTMDLPNAMDPAKVDPQDLQKRKIGFPPMAQLPDKTSAPGKPNSQRMVNTEAFSFAEDVLALKRELENEIANRLNE